MNLRQTLRIVRKEAALPSARKTITQTALLFGARLLLLGFSLLTGMLNARYLEPSGYGIYSFVLSLLSFTNIFFGFGLYHAAAQLMAETNDPARERAIAGGAFVAGSAVALLYVAFILILSFFVDALFRTNVRSMILYLSSVAWSLPLQLMLLQVLKGSNRITDLALLDVLPKALYLGSAWLVGRVTGLSVTGALFLHLGGMVVSCGYALLRLQPSFVHVRAHLRDLLRETKQWGFSIFIGSIADTSTYRTDTLLIATFSDTTSVGYYTMAGNLVSPLPSLSIALATSLFKGFATSDRVPRKVILANVAWLVAALLVLLLPGRWIIRTLFTSKFLPSVPLMLPLAIAAFFQGLYQPLTLFLAAHKKGKELRFTAFVQAGFNVVGNLVLIYLWGPLGAGIASAIAKAIELTLNVHFYRKTQASLPAEPDHEPTTAIDGVRSAKDR